MRTHTLAHAHVNTHATRYTRSIREMLSRAAAGGQGGQAAGPKWGQSVHAFMLLPRICLHCVCVCLCAIAFYMYFRYFISADASENSWGCLPAPPSPSLPLSLCGRVLRLMNQLLPLLKSRNTNETKPNENHKRSERRLNKSRNGDTAEERERERGQRGQRAQPAKIQHNSTHRWAA